MSPFVASFVNRGTAKGPRLALVIHMAEGGNTVAYLARANPNGVSVHYVIERSGRTVQMLTHDRMHTSIRVSSIRTTDDPDGFYGATAARAVMGRWADTRESLGPNHASIAVEVEGFADEGPNPRQDDALGQLWRELTAEYPDIRALGHRDFANYKVCPGREVDWSVVGGHGAEVEIPEPPPTPPTVRDDPMDNLFPDTQLQYALDLPAGTVFYADAGLETRYSATVKAGTFGLLGAPVGVDAYRVANGDRGVFVARGSLKPRRLAEPVRVGK